ncbi:hypothetical protein K469DRAFT_701538 [Zopfia rhizophila CBS 207.26]|uniref:C2H2-type domain-containing protein n=1 Tax=Zopfia rhizophila CBS 207.26 TaxID=1314779 RepID=A0A6A6DB67_9PEZI|nr:hypothetical protein K469DRAFT_701538 [Zopfia rhizophila CBS 207.26]
MPYSLSSPSISVCTLQHASIEQPRITIKTAYTFDDFGMFGLKAQPLSLSRSALIASRKNHKSSNQPRFSSVEHHKSNSWMRVGHSMESNTFTFASPCSYYLGGGFQFVANDCEAGLPSPMRDLLTRSNSAASRSSAFKNKSSPDKPAPLPTEAVSSLRAFSEVVAMSGKHAIVVNSLAQYQHRGNEDRTILDALGPKRDIPLPRVVERAISGIKGCAGNDGSDRASSPPSGSSAGITMRSASPSTTMLDSRHKRGRRLEKSSRASDGESDDENDDRRKRPKSKSPVDHSRSLRRLKCPFYQRRPEKHTRASCRGSGFVDMAKLKDHLKRVHTKPLRCERCWKEIASTESYAEHIQKEPICMKRSEPDDDGIAPRKLHDLNFNRAPFSQAKSVEQKWKTLYHMLFPDDAYVPSPFEERGIDAHFKRVLQEALEEELKKYLPEPILTKIKKSIPDILRQCRDRIQDTPHEMGSCITTNSTKFDCIGSVDITPESPTTSSSSKAMKLNDVESNE